MALLTVLSPAQAQDGPSDPTLQPAAKQTADEVLRRAVAAQGALQPDEIRDLYVQFVGQVQERGEKTQSATREYWLRPTDGSFRIKTTAGADPSKPFSERGVLGAEKGVAAKERYWESIRRRRTELSGSNRDHREVIIAIRRDRSEFQRIVRMVLLMRLADADAAVSFASPSKVRIAEDQPYSAKQILGTDRSAEYWVIDVKRKNADPLRLFIRVADDTVRKVIQFDREAPGRIKTVSYFGFYRRNRLAAGMLVPQAFSVYSAVPKDTKSRDEALKVSGRLSVKINDNLDDSTFTPTPSKDAQPRKGNQKDK